MELDDFLRELLLFLNKEFNIIKNTSNDKCKKSEKQINSEIQVGFCTTGNKNSIYISENEGTGPGYGQCNFNSDSIKGFIDKYKAESCKDADLKKRLNNYKLKIVNRPQNLDGKLHAEMNIIRGVLQDMNKSNDYSNITTLYLKGKKTPCANCKKFIDTLNKDLANFIEVIVSDPTSTDGERKHPKDWCNPMNYFEGKFKIPVAIDGLKSIS